MITNFQVENKVGIPRLFQNFFLIANTKFEVILKIFFLKLSNTNMLFGREMVMLRTYTTKKTLTTTK